MWNFVRSCLQQGMRLAESLSASFFPAIHRAQDQPDESSKSMATYRGTAIPEGVTISEGSDGRVVRRYLGKRDGKDAYAVSTFPDEIVHPYSQAGRDRPIVLHQGRFVFQPDDGDRQVDGAALLVWRPIPRVEAFGRCVEITPAHDILTALTDDGAADWSPKPWLELVDEEKLPTIPPASLDLPVKPKPTPTNSAVGPETLRDMDFGASEPIDSLTMAIPNGWEALDAKRVSDASAPWLFHDARTKVSLGTDYDLTVDSIDRYRSTLKELGREGGVALTHLAELKRTDGKQFTLTDSKPVLETLRTGLTLATGRRLDVVLPCGHRDTELVSVWWNTPRVDDFRTAHSLLDPTIAGSQLNELLSRVYDYSRDAARANMLRQATAYFVRSNRGSNLEIEVAQAVSALQLLSYFRLVTEGSVSRGAWKDLSTEQQVREVLNLSLVNTGVSSSFTHLAQVGANLPNPTNDALTILIKMRNVVVHPSRDMPDRWDFYSWYEAWSSAKEFLLLGLLNAVGYSGKYRSVLETDKWLGSVSDVPWI